MTLVLLVCKYIQKPRSIAATITNRQDSKLRDSVQGYEYVACIGQPLKADNLYSYPSYTINPRLFTTDEDVRTGILKVEKRYDVNPPIFELKIIDCGNAMTWEKKRVYKAKRAASCFPQTPQYMSRVSI
jgi:hypothetical protein